MENNDESVKRNIKEEVKHEVDQEERANKDRELKEQEIREDGGTVRQTIEMIEEVKSGRRDYDQSVDEERIINAAKKAIKRIEEVKRNLVKPKTEQGQFIFQKIIEKRLDDILAKDYYASLKVYSFLEKILLSDKITIEDLDSNFLELKDSVSGYFLIPWRDILVETAVKLGLSEEEAKRKYFVKNEKARSHESQTTIALKSSFDDKQRKFYDALSSPEEFAHYLGELRREILLKKGSFLRGLSNEEINRKVSELVNQEINNVIASIVFDIYEVSRRHPNDEFGHIEQHGVMFFTPRDFFLDFTKKVEELEKEIRSDGSSFNLFEGVSIALPERVEVKGRVEDGIELPPFEMVTGRYEILDLSNRENMLKYMKRIYDYIQSEKKRLEYGHNTRYLLKTAAVNDKIKQEGFFKTLANFAANLGTSDLDEMFFDSEIGDIIQQAMAIFEMDFEKQMVQNHWIKRPDLAMTHFTNMPRYEERMIEEFKRRRPDLEEWQITRAIINAQIMFLGVNYQLLHYFSYADPDKAPGGPGLTITDAGDLMLSFYDPGMTQRRFQDKNMTGYGADWMPINVDLDNFDHLDWEKYQAAYNNSFSQGRAAYFDLLPFDWKRVRLGVDPGNISKAGGLTSLRLSTWRIFNGYKHWLGESTLSLTTEGLKGLNAREDVLTESWKRLENIGIDILENFSIHRFIIGGLLKKDEKKRIIINEDYRKNVKHLFGYLYDRYLNQQIAGVDIRNIFLPPEVKTKEQFLSYLDEYFNLKKYLPTEIKDFFIKQFYNIFTVMIFERMPTKIVSLEKERLTQNGVRMYDELRQEFSTYESYEKAYEDLNYVQSQLRVEANEEMRVLLKEKGNLYGDLSKNRSDVKFYLDEEKIERILRKYLKRLNLSDGEIAERIERTKLLYRKILEKASQLPPEAAWEKKILESTSDDKKTKKEKEKVEKLRKQYTTRGNWFAKMLAEDDFGFSFTSGDTSYSFFNFSANGPLLLNRLAGFNSDTAELPAKNWIMDDKWREDRSFYKLNKTYEVIDQVYNAAKGQWGTGYTASKAAMVFLRRTANYFRKDEKRYSNIEQHWKGIFGGEKKSMSFAQEAAGGPDVGDVYQWGLNEFDKIYHEIIGGRGQQYVEKNTPEEEVRVKYTTWGEKYKITGKIIKFLGKFNKKIAALYDKPLKIRDYANEASGNAFRKSQKYWGGFFVKEVFPRLVLIFIIISLILFGKSAADDFVVGGKK
jgi:hypothetical protein